MAWIESHQQMGRHPKTVRLAHRLGVTKAQAIGHLHLLWWWTLDFAPDGDLSVYTPVELAAAAEWMGEAGEFVALLREVGWLDEDLKVHDWRDYAGKLMEERALAKERMRRFRERQREERAARRELSRGVLEEAVGDGGRAEGWRVPLRDNREFCAAWRDWRQHLGEAGRPMSGVQEEAVLWECAQQGPNRGVEVIRFSIRKGARNLIWGDAPRAKAEEGKESEPIDPANWRAFLSEEYPAADGGVSPEGAPEIVREEFQRWVRGRVGAGAFSGNVEA